MWNGDYWKLSGPTKEPLFFHMSFYSQSMKLMQPNCTWRKWKAEFWALSEKLHVATGLKKITRVKIFYWTYQLSRHKQVHHSGYQRKQVTIHELCSAHWEGQKPRHWRLLVTHTHTHQYLLFESHHPLEHKHHQAENVPFKAERKEKEQTHIKRPLRTCGNPNWAFIKSAKRHGNKYWQPPALPLSLLVDPPMVLISKYYATLFSSYSQDSQKTSDFDWETQNNRLSKHNMLVTFSPSKTLRQKLVHPKTGKKQAEQCCEESLD